MRAQHVDGWGKCGAASNPRAPTGAPTLQLALNFLHIARSASSASDERPERCRMPSSARYSAFWSVYCGVGWGEGWMKAKRAQRSAIGASTALASSPYTPSSASPPTHWHEARPPAPPHTCSARRNSAITASAGSGAPYAFSRLSHATHTLNFSPSSR